MQPVGRKMSLSAGVEELQAAHRNAAEALQDCRRRLTAELKAKRRRDVRLAEIFEEAWGVVLLSGGRLDAGALYADVTGVDRQELQTQLERRLDGTSVEDMVEQCTVWSHDAGAAARKARRFVQDRRLVSWVQGMNEVSGVAPSYLQVYDQRGARDDDHPPPSTDRGRRQWVRRFARRWHGRRMQLETKPCQDATAVRSQVLKGFEKVAFWDSKAGSI